MFVQNSLRFPFFDIVRVTSPLFDSIEVSGSIVSSVFSGLIHLLPLQPAQNGFGAMIMIFLMKRYLSI